MGSHDDCSFWFPPTVCMDSGSQSFWPCMAVLMSYGHWFYWTIITIFFPSDLNCYPTRKYAAPDSAAAADNICPYRTDGVHNCCVVPKFPFGFPDFGAVTMFPITLVREIPNTVNCFDRSRMASNQCYDTVMLAFAHLVSRFHLPAFENTFLLRAFAAAWVLVTTSTITQCVCGDHGSPLWPWAALAFYAITIYRTTPESLIGSMHFPNP